MTKQELIDHLQHLEQYTHYSEDAPALREVIEMLECSEMPNGSDTISRQAAIDALGDKPLAWTEGEYELGLQNQWQSDVDALKALPSAQPDLSEYSDKLWRNAYERGKREAQPDIIRCKDCKHWKHDHTCREHSLVSPMMANEFCSRAERREE